MISDDFTINGKDIRHTSGDTKYTVLAFHRWLYDIVDERWIDPNSPCTEDMSRRASDEDIYLLRDYNIDEYTSQFLINGRLTQGLKFEAKTFMLAYPSVLSDNEVLKEELKKLTKRVETLENFHRKKKSTHRGLT